MMDYKTNRINKLKYEFGESNLNSKEIVSSEYRREINRKYKEKQDIFIIDGVLCQLDNHVRKMIKEEVYHICNSFRLKELCYNCKIEVIISIIILYVWKSRYSQLREDRTALWKKYDLTWKKYGLVIGNILRKTRENNPI